MKIYYTFEKVNSHEFLFHVLEKNYGVLSRALRYGKNGKPYLSDEGPYFSLSHSHDLTAIAVSDEEIGLDAEFLKNDRKYTRIVAALSPAERKEIVDRENFFRHWTAKESYVKFRGGAIEEAFPRLAYVNGILTEDGKTPPIKLSSFIFGDYAVTLCRRADSNEPIEAFDLTARTTVLV